MIRCINQVFRPKVNVLIENQGNCSICHPDKNNVNCSGYYPINIVTVEVRTNGNSNYINKRLNGKRLNGKKIKHPSLETNLSNEQLESIEEHEKSKEYAD